MATGNALVFWSCNILGGALDPTNWSGRIANQAVTWTVALSLINRVILTGRVIGAADPGPDVVSYSPPPFDVINATTGTPALAFTDFPMTQAP